MSRIGIFGYGVISYLVFFAVFLYGIGFIGGFLTPTSLDGVPTSTLGHALTVDLALLAAFAVQHSGMARPAFKTWWKRFVPEAAERCTGHRAQQHHRVVPVRLAAASVHDLPHRSLRSVWIEAGMAAAVQQKLPRPGVSHTQPVQARAPSLVHRLADDLLGRAHHDRRALDLCARHHRLHSHRDPFRGAGSGVGVRNDLCGLSRAHADAHSAALVAKRQGTATNCLKWKIAPNPGRAHAPLIPPAPRRIACRPLFIVHHVVGDVDVYGGCWLVVGYRPQQTPNNENSFCSP